MSPSRITRAVHTDQRVGEFVDVLELAARPHEDSIVRGREHAGRRDRVLRIDRIADLFRREAELGELGIGDLDVDALLLVGDEVDLVDAGHAQQLGTQPLRIVVHLRGREAIALERIEVRIDVAELIVEERALDPGWQRIGDIADFLADLVPRVGDLRRRRGVLDREEQHRLAGARIAAQEVDVGRLLELARDTVGHFLLDLARGRARPESLDHHDLESERRVFRLRELAVREHAEQRDQGGR